MPQLLHQPIPAQLADQLQARRRAPLTNLPHRPG
jgi:hypothetical protein